MAVIYAEKPDMAEKIASSLGGSTFNRAEKKNGFYNIQYKGENFQVTWGYGHLCALAEASDYNSEYKNWSKMPMPFIPNEFKIILNEKSKMPVKQTYKVVNDLFKRADYIINATDYDREGELIFYYLYAYSRCNKPVKRVKLTSTTVNGITEAFANIVPASDMYNLLESAKCRSIADWVVGCNLTALMTLKVKGKQIYPIGRVQTPTLNMVVKRDEEIENFKPENYYTLEGNFTKSNGEQYKGEHKAKRFKNKIDAENIKNKCSGKNGVVTHTEKSEKQKLVPNLYNLDLLQMDANSIHGMNIKKTLDVTQKLYEKGYVTYPRTDCQFLPEDMFDKIVAIQNRLKNTNYGQWFNQDASVNNMRKNRSRFFDDKKLGSHFAIIPTEVTAVNLTPDEQKIYDLIAYSVIRMLYPNAIIENQKIVTTVEGEDFITTGTAVKENGWLFVNAKLKETLIPSLKENEPVKALIQLLSKKTEPPKRYTDKTLLSAMISAGKSLEDDELKQFMLEQKIDGIGTVATRASIIENLISRKLLERNKKNIVSTTTGRNLIHVIPIDEVKSAMLTAKYEKRLNNIAKGNEPSSQFLSDIYNETTNWCNKISAMEVKIMDTNTTDMICPICGNPLLKYNWGYGCSAHKDGCGFTISNTICSKTLTENQIKELLAKGRIGPISGFVSKAGKNFEASLILEETMDNGLRKFRTKFEFPQSNSRENEVPEIYASCPNCNGRIVKGRWGWECENKCGISVPYTLCQRNIKPAEAEALLSHGTTDILEGFISKKGNPFVAGLTVNGTKVEFYFPQRN